MSFNSQDALKEARDQLTLVLSFFQRVDSKASVILALNTGMLGFLASKSPSINTLTYLSIIMSLLTIAPIGVSLWFLYRVTFPSLNGGQQSLIFFREIASRTESLFIDQFTAQDYAARTKDLLGQVWRNSEILKLKFHALRGAFICTAIAVVQWTIAVGLFSIQGKANLFITSR